jgi:Tol biopolymer transport system component
MNINRAFALSDEVLRGALTQQPDDSVATDIAASLTDLLSRTPQLRRSLVRWPWLADLPGVQSSAQRRVRTVALVALVALLVAISVALIGLAGSLRSQWKPEGLVILISDGNLVAQNPDGTGVRTLASGLGEAASPTVSPDGARLAFWTSYDPSFPTTLEVLDLAARTRRVISGSVPLYPGQHMEVSWSPDSRFVAFSGGIGSAFSKLYLAAVDGTQLKEVNADLIVSSPSWSPDGLHIAFRGVEPGDVGSSGLYLVKPDGTGLRRLVQRTEGEPQSSDFVSAAWSADAAFIAYSEYSGLTTSSYDLQVVDIASGGTWTVSAERTDEYSAWFSPDGRWIAFIASSPNGASIEPNKLVIVHPDGSERRVLDLDTESFAWAPDSTHLLANTAAGLWQVAIDGSGRSIVPTPSDSCCVVWLTPKRPH